MRCDFLVLTGMIKPKQNYGYGKKNGSMAIVMPIGVFWIVFEQSAYNDCVLCSVTIGIWKKELISDRTKK